MCNNGADQQFAILMSMGYLETYIERAMKVHRKSRRGTDWNLSILVEIIERLKKKEEKNIRHKRKHYKSVSLQFGQSEYNSYNWNNSNSNMMAHRTKLKLIPKPFRSKIDELDELYMKAVNLYSNKHYEECERITKEVLRTDPNHQQALKLYTDLVQQRLSRCSNDDKRRKHKIKPKQKRKRKKKGKTNSMFGWKKRNKMHPCQIEFARFIREKIQLNEYYPDLASRFVSAKYDDIRLLKDFDAEMLQNEIGLKALYCTLFMRKVKIFIDETRLFAVWLTDIVKKQNMSINACFLADLFENNGITTFESLYSYIQSKNDLNVMMKSLNNYNMTDIVWNEMQLKKMRPVSSSIIFEEEEKYHEDVELNVPPIPLENAQNSSVMARFKKKNKKKKGKNKKHRRSQTMDIAVHKKNCKDIENNKSRAHHWGFTDRGDVLGENEKSVSVSNDILQKESYFSYNVENEDFLAELSPSVKSIEDMYTSPKSKSKSTNGMSLEKCSNIDSYDRL